MSLNNRSIVNNELQTYFYENKQIHAVRSVSKHSGLEDTCPNRLWVSPSQVAWGPFFWRCHCSVFYIAISMWSLLWTDVINLLWGPPTGLGSQAVACLACWTTFICSRVNRDRLQSARQKSSTKWGFVWYLLFPSISKTWVHILFWFPPLHMCDYTGFFKHTDLLQMVPQVCVHRVAEGKRVQVRLRRENSYYEQVIIKMLKLH